MRIIISFGTERALTTMEALLQQECLTESQLQAYKSQLGLVEGQLGAGRSEADTADLEQLRENLSQLISLTEDTLLDLKKQRLLLSLQSVGGETAIIDDTGQSKHVVEAEKEKEKGEDEEEDEPNVDGDDNLQGIKCQAPMQEPWGAVNYHNAVILCREEDTTVEKSVDLKVCVLFTQPTSKAMKPCPFYLDGKCRFEASACKFSHGHSVSFSDLLTFQEPDYNLACVGGKCLAKHSDDLWYPGIISSLEDEFTIHFPSLGKTVQTPIQNVFPLDGSESSSSCCSSESGEEEGGGEGEGVVEWTPSGALGDWEKHTTGIGSKLLAKMGYVVGRGLGRRGEGRVEPVEIKILPPGKSLDACAEMREKGKLRKAPGEGEEGQGKRRRRRKRKLLAAAGIEEERKVDIFDFLNAKLRENKSAATSSRHNSGNLNVQLFKVQEDIKSVLKRRQSLQTQLARHKGRDKTMEAHVLEKLSAVDREMDQLQTEERRVEKSLEIRSDRKKLRIF